jgi:hypothetical protein
MNAVLKKMKADFEKKKREFYALQQKISDKEDELAVPGLKEKFEGKYFRYHNTQGGDEKWFIYSHVRQVVSANRGIIDTFQIAPLSAEFSVCRNMGFVVLGEEISELEYKNAAIEFIKHVQKLL